MKVININTFSNFMTEKKAHTFSNLNEGDEIYITWGPLVKCVLLELFILYDDNGLRPYVLFCNDELIVISLVEET